MNISFIPVSKDNYKIAEQLHAAIFPEYPDTYTFAAISGLYPLPPKWNNLVFWIIYDGDVPVGICGLYGYDDYPADAWGGWMGVLPAHRGVQILVDIRDFLFDYARAHGYKTLRLYTDPVVNAAATKIYERAGMYREEYTNADKPVPTTLIFSQSLNDEPVRPWNNRPLFLNEFHAVSEPIIERNKQNAAGAK